MSILLARTTWFVPSLTPDEGALEADGSKLVAELVVLCTATKGFWVVVELRDAEGDNDALAGEDEGVVLGVLVLLGMELGVSVVKGGGVQVDVGVVELLGATQVEVGVVEGEAGGVYAGVGEGVGDGEGEGDAPPPLLPLPSENHHVMLSTPTLVSANRSKRPCDRSRPPQSHVGHSSVIWTPHTVTPFAWIQMSLKQLGPG